MAKVVVRKKIKKNRSSVKGRKVRVVSKGSKSSAVIRER